MQNIIDKFLLIKLLPLVEDIQREFKKSMFDGYVLAMAKILAEKSFSHITSPMCPHPTCGSMSWVKNIDYDTLTIKFLRMLNAEPHLTFNGNAINAESSCDTDTCNFAAQITRTGIKLYGNVCVSYNENTMMSFLLYDDIDNLLELILHQNKFFRTFMERFKGYDEIKYNDEAPKFVEDFPIL